MKYKLLTILVFVILVPVAVGFDCGATARPQLPHRFEGYALYSGSVRTGKTVVATLAGNTFTTTTNSNGWYALDIARCDDSSATSISFTVCARAASETGTYSSGADPTTLNLTIVTDCAGAAAPTPTPTGGGTAGGGTALPTTTPAEEPTAINLDDQSSIFTDEGYTATQAQGGTATFTFGGTSYTVEVAEVADDSVTITIGDQSIVLAVGESAEFDVDGDGINDISVTLVSITDGEAELIYKMLAKAIEEEPAEEVPVEEEEEPTFIEEEVKKAGIGWIFIVVIIVVGLIMYFVVKRKKSSIE